MLSAVLALEHSGCFEMEETIFLPSDRPTDILFVGGTDSLLPNISSVKLSEL